MTISKIEKLLKSTKYDINLSHKESLLTRLIEKKENNIFKFSIFNLMNIKQITMIAAVLLLMVAGLYSYSLYNDSKLYSSLKVNKVYASSNEMSDYTEFKKTNVGEIFTQKGTDVVSVMATENGKTVYYVWESVSNDLEKEAKLVIDKVKKGEYSDASIGYDSSTGKTTITVNNDKNNITNNTDDAGAIRGNQGTGVGVQNGTATKDDSLKDIVYSDDYTKCLNTKGSYIREIYPPVCVYPNGTEVAAQYK